MAVKTEKGRKSIDGNVYKEFVGKELVCIEENMSLDRVDEVLKSEFGLVRINDKL